MLVLDRLNAFYGDSHVLHDITLNVGENTRLAVLGRNGAGKSTLLKSLIGDQPTITGGLAWQGRSIAGAPAYERARLGFSYVPEDRRIFPMLTVTENILLANRASGQGDRTFKPGEMFDMFPMLKPLASRYGDQLSGGQQQMLAVARGLSVRPRLLLLDEPAEGLAPVIVEALAEAIASQCAALGITLVLCEQNIWFARQCTDKVCVLNNGSIVFEGGWKRFDRNADLKLKYLAV